MRTAEDCQSFLANGLEEALGGAIKLARYARHKRGARSTGIVLDPADRLTDFAGSKISGNEHVPFLPGLMVVGNDQLGSGLGTLSASHDGRDGGDIPALDLLVLVAGADALLDRHAKAIRRLVLEHQPLVITCVDRAGLAALRGGSGGILQEIVPDIVVFDDSFVDHAVPFSAFTAGKSLFASWNRTSKATFHSTTFQPNTISTRHFMACLAESDPEFHRRYHDDLEEMLTDLSRRADRFGRHYSPPLLRLIRATGFRARDVRAAGSFVRVNGRAVFDAVSGVASSFRGHNPPAYADEMAMLESLPPPERGGQRTRFGVALPAVRAQVAGQGGSGGAADSPLSALAPREQPFAERKTLSRETLGSATPKRAASTDAETDHHAELRRRLLDLTGLGYVLPAVSGATAVENALKLALVVQFPKRHVLALKAGFGGKTLFALTGTANASYKERVGPLYSNVHYVDPFAPDALAQIDALLETHDVAVVQMELIQAVGGVRHLPGNVIRHLDAGRKRWGYLLLVDEVQTGMYRTGPFVLSQTFDLTPDIMLLGKATSDMMFPFALTLYSEAVHHRHDQRGGNLTASITKNHGYEHGFRTVLNVLRLGEDLDVEHRVGDAGELFARLLKGGLASSKIVRDVRVFGLLIAIELNIDGWPRRWLRKRLASLYLLGMLRHDDFPLLAGLCQYEPNVIKITPPLSASPAEIRQACATIIDVLSRPLYKVVGAALGALIKSPSFDAGRKTHEHANDAALEPATR